MATDITRKSKDRSVKELVTDLRGDASLLVRQEIALAKAELKEKARGMAKQAAFFGAAGVLGYTGILVLLAALILAVIALGVVAWLATLGVAVIVMLGAFVLVQRARHLNKTPRA
jgi:uncharacterized membrane protein